MVVGDFKVFHYHETFADLYFRFDNPAEENLSKRYPFYSHNVLQSSSFWKFLI